MTAEATTAHVNGSGPGPAAPEPAVEGVPVTDRVMGLIMCALALGAVFIGIDLATGGALSGRLFGGEGDDAG